MLDDEIKAVQKLQNKLFKSLRNPDGTWKKEKHSVESKELCNDIKSDIESHCKICKICNKSMEEYKQTGIPLTPPCKNFESYMREHIKLCPVCNSAQNNWNDDAIPVTPQMRAAVKTLFKLKGMCGI